MRIKLPIKDQRKLSEVETLAPSGHVAELQQRQVVSDIFLLTVTGLPLRKGERKGSFIMKNGKLR